ncbi:DUF6544 family protein [Fodinibius halophilus]|nr:DUF6544 family protein [Fodinibius halophilus]
MIKVGWSVIVLLHGFIHLMGFLKAYNLASIDQLVLPISRTSGLIWLGAFLLFIASVFLYLFQIDWWWIIAAVAVIVSQALIVTYWEDAKFGTVANVIIMAGGILGYGHWSFNAMVDRELDQFWNGVASEQTEGDGKKIDDLPPVVQKWLNQSDINNQEAVKLNQKGRLKTTPEGSWMLVEADQYVNVDSPEFLWIADVQMASYIHLAGRDKYKDGKGHMLIKLLSLFPVANAKGAKIDQATLVRYLAEIVWYPRAATKEYIEWEQIEERKARATIENEGIITSGIFEFNKEGMPVQFEAERYYSRKEGATLETWLIDIEPSSYRVFDGMKIPTKASVTWQLDDGEFTWYLLEITDATYYSDIPQ